MKNNFKGSHSALGNYRTRYTMQRKLSNYIKTHF